MKKTRKKKTIKENHNPARIWAMVKADEIWRRANERREDGPF